MVWALIQLQLWSMGNRIRSQLRRLKQPKYLAGAVAGFAYFYFFIGRGFVRGGLPGGDPGTVGTEWGALVEVVAAFGIAFFVWAAWFFPEKRAALEFSEAEVAFLFPAPISRRGLVHFRILRAQFQLLFGALVMTFFLGRFARGAAWCHLIGWWLMLSALELHRLGAAFTRTRLADRGFGVWPRRVVVLAITVVALTVFGLWARMSYAPPGTGELAAAEGWARYLAQAADTGPWFWMLLPFRVVVRPMLAGTISSFLVALLPLLGGLAVLYVWVLRSVVSFEEATLERAEQMAKTVAAVRSGRWHLARPARKRQDPFVLHSQGPRVVALLWKNLISMGTAFTPRLWIGLAVTAGVSLVVMRGFFPGSVGLQLLGLLPVGLAPLLFLMGPQLLTMDLRQDLTMADLLKVYPLPGWQLVLGEVAAPVIVLTLVQWLAIGFAVVAFPGPAWASMNLDWGARLGVGLAVALVAPGLNLVSFLIQNGIALAFPAWARLGPGQQQGFEGMGRGILLMVGQLLALGLTLALPAGAFAGAFFLTRTFLPWVVCLPLGAMIALALLLIEAYAGLRMLGDLFERMDIASELQQAGA